MRDLIVLVAWCLVFAIGGNVAAAYIEHHKGETEAKPAIPDCLAYRPDPGIVLEFRECAWRGRTCLVSSAGGIACP